MNGGLHSAISPFGQDKEADEKAIVVTDQAAGTAGMMLVERPEPQAQ